MDPDEGKSFSMNLHLSLKLIVSVIPISVTIRVDPTRTDGLIVSASRVTFHVIFM